MPFNCDVENCQNLSVRVHGDCIFCQRRLCSQHLQRPSRTCPQRDEDAYDAAIGESQKLEIQRLLSQINVAALTDHATHLRNGCPYVVIQTNLKSLSKVMGNVNFHLELRFNDDVRWIVRIKRQNVTVPSRPVQKYVIESEVATYHFLSTIQVPVPKVFAFCSSVENVVGVPYILMEKIAGRPYSESKPKPEQKYKVIEQLAAVYNELHQHPFNAIGSLNLDGSIGPLASELVSDCDNEGGTKLLGPFQNLQQYYNQTISRILIMIANGELCSPWAVETYLIHCSLLDLAGSYLHSSTEDQKFYLRHYDDQGSHIMVDDDYIITGIIDWEWAYTAPAWVAFTSPMMLWDVGEFFNGNKNLSKVEIDFAGMLDIQSQVLGKYVNEGKDIQRLHFILGNEIFDWDMSSYIQNFAALHDADFKWDAWKTEAIEKYRDDKGLKRLLGI